MRHFYCLIAVLSVFALSGCNEENLESHGMLGAFPSEAVSSADAMLSKKRRVSSAVPSKLALDRSKFNNRRIAETHSMKVEATPDMLKSRYDRDFQKCLELGCEVTTSNVNTRRSGYIHARIAPEQLPAYLDFIGAGPGELKEHSVRADDKTLQYIDTDAKIKNLEALKIRLIDLLDSPKAENISQILQIERELNRVEQQLDSAKGSIRHLQTITGKATVNVNYSVPYQDFKINTYEFKNSFKRGYQDFLNNVSEAIRFVAGFIPWIPVWVIGLWGAVKGFRFAFGRGFSLMFWKRDKVTNKGDVKAKAKKAKS